MGDQKQPLKLVVRLCIHHSFQTLTVGITLSVLLSKTIPLLFETMSLFDFKKFSILKLDLHTNFFNFIFMSNFNIFFFFCCVFVGKMTYRKGIWAADTPRYSKKERSISRSSGVKKWLCCCR